MLNRLPPTSSAMLPPATFWIAGAATLPQRVDKSNYSFLSWSDGGAQDHVIRTPALNTAYTGFYRKKGRR